MGRGMGRCVGKGLIRDLRELRMQYQLRDPRQATQPLCIRSEFNKINDFRVFPLALHKFRGHSAFWEKILREQIWVSP